LLPIIEGSEVSTKYGNVKTDYILFICSGAFHSVKPSDLSRSCREGCRSGSRFRR